MNKSLKVLMIIILTLIITNFIQAQNYKVTGTVRDETTGESLIGANIFIPDLNIGAVTNTEGFYSIENVKEGTYQVTVSYIGYLKQNKNIKISGNTKLNFSKIFII